MSTQPLPFTHEEVERMRQIVMSHDKAMFGGIKEFDLNKPPKEPYRYQEFPRCLYHHATAKTKNVANQAELEQHLSAGWSKDPCPIEAPEPELDEATLAETAELDRIAHLPRKKAARA